MSTMVTNSGRVIETELEMDCPLIWRASVSGFYDNPCTAYAASESEAILRALNEMQTRNGTPVPRERKDLPDEFWERVNSGNTIPAIKILREISGLSLRGARDLVVAIREERANAS